MERTYHLRKLLTIGTILLFIGIAVVPSINQSVAKASTDDDFVEITTQACGIKGYRDTTVKLTREQYNALEQYLVGFRAKLNQTSTRAEAVPLFKETVVELDKYGLLPRGMSIERAQKLVIGGTQNVRLGEVIKKLSHQNKKMVDENVNAFCLFSGKTDYTSVISFMIRLLSIPLLILVAIVDFFSDLPIFYTFAQFLLWQLVFLLNSSPIGFNQWISYGDLIGYPEGYFYPARGWIYTNGLNGIKTWNGSFSGGLYSGIFLYIGAFDFTGISLVLPLKGGGRFCLGTALIAKFNDY